MKFVPARYSAAGAAAVLITAVAISQHAAIEAFAPVVVKGRESGIRSSPFTLAMTAEATVYKSTTQTSTSGPKKPKFTKRKKGTKQKQNKGSKQRVVVVNAPNQRKKGAPKRKVKKNTESIIKPLKDLKLGSKVSGTVVDVCDFGAFVRIGYATRGSRAGTALLHISRISEEKVQNIYDVFKVGDTVEDARVINIDSKKGEVGLSLRSSRAPRRRDVAELKVGDELEGKVNRVVPYGVFVDVGVNVNALLHISRITGGAIENVRFHLNEGDSVSVHVIDVDVEKRTLAVSMLDKKADQYLDRRMSQRLNRFYGTAAGSKSSRRGNRGRTSTEGKNSEELKYFDIAIRELEQALRSREETK